MHRNAQQHSSDKSQPSADDYATINVQTQGDQPQYNVIQLQHHQPGGTSADGYATLGKATLGEQHQYEAIQQPAESHGVYMNVVA